jgi:hypothetical protein
MLATAEFNDLFNQSPQFEDNQNRYTFTKSQLYPIFVLVKRK